jgi:hypothetical protein
MNQIAQVFESNDNGISRGFGHRISQVIIWK